MITILMPGDCYVPKVMMDYPVSIQVGMGADCGIFRGEPSEATFKQSPLFRVLINQPNLKRNWRNAGSFPMTEAMAEFPFYGDTDFGTSNFYRVKLDDVDHRISISKEEFDKLERLAVWETEHIRQRVADPEVSLF